MKTESLDSRMRKGEYFHGLRVPTENWTILRLDGRGFSRLTGENFEKPFDLRFHQLMLETTKALASEFNTLYAYTESDEISLLLPYEWDFFDREVEKVLSISASVASSTFSCAFGSPVQFDSRIWISGRAETVADYFLWRQNDATRCALNGWAYWNLRLEGLNADQATRKMSGLKGSELQELLFQQGQNFNDLPNWQKRGSGLRFEDYLKEGFNPKTQEKVEVTRRRLSVLDTLPFGEEYRAFLLSEIVV